ncbi:MAG: RnfABCDGE type electron transport complex subunit A [Firmicutes bacterium]|nr:RnfABCDGE type electron transport complex subunit A [Bacillota bacterium]
MTELVLLFVGSALVNNFILTRFLGICPFLGVTKELKSAAGMGAAVTFVLSLTSILVWLVHHLILVPLDLVFLQYAVYILIIAVLVQLLELFLRKTSRALYDAFGIYLALITTNCAIMGLALLIIAQEYTLAESLLFALGGGAGFSLAMCMMAGIRQELRFADVPVSVQGPALALLIAGIMSMTFMGFSGLVAM